MADNKEYMTHKENMGMIKISEDVVASIAATTALETEGVCGLQNANVADIVGGKKMTAKGVRVEMVDDAIVVNLFLVMRYGYTVSELAKKVQVAVFTALRDMTGFEVRTVNVHVSSISFEAAPKRERKGL